MPEISKNVSLRLENLENEFKGTITGTYKGSIYFICKCGIEARINKYSTKLLLCKECTKKYLKKYSTNRISYGTIKNRVAEEGVRILCSKDEWTKFNANTPILLRCSCGEIYKRRYGRLFENDDSGNRRSAKCLPCIRSEKFSGKKHPGWKGGKSISNRKIIGLSRHDRWWERAVKRQYKYRCVISETTGRRLICSHHLEGYGTNKDLRLDTKNGVCISRKLHIEFHRRYDNFKGTCTREQFAEFYYEKTGKNFNDVTKSINYENCPFN